jgi:hypothetical protein
MSTTDKTTSSDAKETAGEDYVVATTNVQFIKNNITEYLFSVICPYCHLLEIKPAYRLESEITVQCGGCDRFYFAAAPQQPEY